MDNIEPLTIIISVIIIYVVYSFILLPLILLLKYRLQGVPIIRYYPITGLWGIFKKDFQNYGDSFKIFKDVGMNHPNASSFAVNLGSNVVLFLVDQNMIKQFYQMDCYEKNPFVKTMLERLMGNSLVIDEISHSRKRRVFSKIFHFDNLKQTVPKIQERTEEKIKEYIIQNNNNNNNNNNNKGNNSCICLDIINFGEQISGDIITRQFFGIDMKEIHYKNLTIGESMSKLNRELSNQMRSMRYVLTGAFTHKLGLFQKDRDINIDIKENKSLLLQSLNQRINSIHLKQNNNIQSQSQNESNHLLNSNQNTTNNNNNGNQGLDVIEYLIQSNGILNKQMCELNEQEKEDLEKSNQVLPEEIFFEYSSFYLAGMETSGHTIGFVFYYYIKYPEVRAKINKEIQQFIQSDSKITYETISKLDYIDCFIKEILRHYGPTASLFTRLVSKDHKIGNIELKKGTLANVAIMSNFYNPTIFENPQEFKPERWYEQNKYNSYSYLPFSSGKRNCIGQHLALIVIKVVMLTILKDYHVSLVDNNYTMDLLQQFVHGPSKPILINLIKKIQS